MRIALCVPCRLVTERGGKLICRADDKPIPKNGVCDFNSVCDFQYFPRRYGGNKKGPAALGDAGGQGRGRNQEQGQNATDAGKAQGKFCLPSLADDGNLDFPFNRESHSRRLARFQDGAKDLNITASNARIGLVHIGGVQRPGTCEDPAAYREPGSVVTLPFSFNPLIREVLHG